MTSVVYINYTVFVINSLKEVSRIRLAVRPLSLVATYDLKELMFRDWATQNKRRRGTFLQRDRHSPDRKSVQHCMFRVRYSPSLVTSTKFLFF